MAEPPTELPPASEEKLGAWREEQGRLAARVVHSDDFPWSVTASSLFVAGLDLSFPTTSATEAVATVAVVHLQDNSMRTVFSHSERVEVTTPYAPSFLAFREAPIAASLFRSLPETVRSRVHALIVDGNGALHARGAGLACHLGVLLNVPTVGVSKTLYAVDGLDVDVVRDAAAADPAGAAPIIGQSGRDWGRALLTGNATRKPVYVSVGHRICIESAAKLVRRLCRFRVPEPVRVADLHSREALRTGKLVEVWEKDAFPA